VVATIYEQLSDEVANQLEAPSTLSVMTPAKEVVKTVTNKQAKAGTWLWPKSEASLDGRFMVIVRKGVSPTLKVNGKPVPKSQVGEQIENRREKAQVVAWYGVKLEEGENNLEVVAKDMFGNNRVLAKGKFTRPASADKLKISTEMKQLPADGGRSYAVGLVEIGANAFERDANSPFTDETTVDSRVAGFMKGGIRGDMHLTMSVEA